MKNIEYLKKSNIFASLKVVLIYQTFHKKMGKYYIISLSIIYLLFALSCKKGDDTVIKGDIANLSDSYILASYLSSDSLIIDTIPVYDNSKFNYKVNIDTLITFSLYMNESSTVVFADKGQKVTLKGDALFPDLIKVNGNEINNDLTAFKNDNQDLLKQRGQLLSDLHVIKDSVTSRNNSLSRSDDISNLNLLNHDLTLKAEEYIKENPTKMSSLILINNFFTNSDTPKSLERVLGYLEGDVVETNIAKRLQAYSQKLNISAEDVIVPYFQLTDNEGELINSDTFRGKYLLLSFLSNTGVESHETIELLKNEHEVLSNDSVQFVSIYIDSDIYPIEVEHDSIPWIVVAENRGWGSDIVDLLNIQYIPFNILINPEGAIMLRNVPAQEVAEMVARSSEN